MADNQPTNTNVNDPTPPAGTGLQPDVSGLFTQEQVNAIAGKARIDAREALANSIKTDYGDLDILKAAKQRLDDIEAANLSETEKLKREIEQGKQREAAAAQKAVDAERAALRLKVGQLKGLPVVLAERLQGDTEDELIADADRLLAEIGQPAKPKPPDLNATAGAGGGMGARKPALTPDQEQALAQAQKVDPKMTRERYIARLQQMQGGG